MDEELVLVLARNGFSELLQHPFRGRMCGHVVMQNPPAAYFHDHEHVQHSKTGCDSNQEITG